VVCLDNKYQTEHPLGLQGISSIFQESKNMQTIQVQYRCITHVSKLWRLYILYMGLICFGIGLRCISSKKFVTCFKDSNHGRGLEFEIALSKITNKLKGHAT
jgi:hypothetical protein